MHSLCERKKPFASPPSSWTGTFVLMLMGLYENFKIFPSVSNLTFHLGDDDRSVKQKHIIKATDEMKAIMKHCPTNQRAHDMTARKARDMRACSPLFEPRTDGDDVANRSWVGLPYYIKPAKATAAMIERCRITERVHAAYRLRKTVCWQDEILQFRLNPRWRLHRYQNWELLEWLREVEPLVETGKEYALRNGGQRIPCPSDLVIQNETRAFKRVLLLKKQERWREKEEEMILSDIKEAQSTGLLDLTTTA